MVELIEHGLFGCYKSHLTCTCDPVTWRHSIDTLGLSTSQSQRREEHGSNDLKRRMVQSDDPKKCWILEWNLHPSSKRFPKGGSR